MGAFFLKSIVAILITVASAHALAAQRPNFLLITADDMDQESVGIFGSPVADVTPNIDRLAREGLRFTNGHVTIAVCQPSRAALMTGRYPHHSGAMGFEEIRPDAPTLPETLSNAGYYTGIFGKTEHTIPSRAAAWNVKVAGGELGRKPEQYRRFAREFFREAKTAHKPFFLNANILDPHRPFSGSAQEQKAIAEQARRTLYGRVLNKLGLASWANTSYPAPPAYAYQPDQIAVPGYLPDLPEVRREVAQYYTSVRRGDEAVGAVLAELEAAGLADNTLVVFLADNGASFPFSKANTYRVSTRAAWIVRWPGIVGPGRVDEDHLVSGIDLLPTVLDALGLAPLEAIDGRSFVPILHGQKQNEFQEVFTYFFRTPLERTYPMRAVQTTRYGYIYNPWSDGQKSVVNETQLGLTWPAMESTAAKDADLAARVKMFLTRAPEEFYDYAADPNALHNAVTDPALASVRDRLRQDLLHHMQTTNDPNAADFAKWLESAGR